MYNKEVVKQYESGKTLKEVADIYGVSKQRISQVLQYEKVPCRSRIAVSYEMKEKVKALAEDHKTHEEIKKETGLSSVKIHKALKETGFNRDELEYRCGKCGGSEWRSNGKGKLCVPCSAKRAREYYRDHGKAKKVAE